MKNSIILIVLLFFLISCSNSSKESESQGQQQSEKKIIAYVHGLEDNWGRNNEKAKQITHINYAFANIKDGRVVEGDTTNTYALQKLNELKQTNPNLKILISVGGWSWSGNFSDAVLTEASRQIFANSAIEFMLQHKIDGIDLDWEYPGLVGAGNVHRPEDKENFTAILKLIRHKLDSLGTNNKYLLTIATGASQQYLDHTDMGEAQKYLDFINIMTYDFYTGGSKKTGHHSNLKASQYETDIARSTEIAVQQHIDVGIPATKLVVGVPFYGRWWKGANPTNQGLYQEASGATGGFTYKQIADSLNANVGFVEKWDESAQAPYISRVSDLLFLTYENPKSLKLKVDYVNQNQLGGIMFWQYNGDNGELLQTINTHLK